MTEPSADRAGVRIPDRVADRVATALVPVAVLPVLVAAVRALGRGWTPLGDNGLILLRSHDVGTGNHPLLGTWTSASLVAGRPINNPGPLWFDWLAPFVRLFGPSVGMAIGVAAANAAAIALAAWAARRAGGRDAMIVVTVLSAALTWTMGSELLFDAWQPHAMILPCWALLMWMWALATGDLWAAPWVVGLASVLVQTHLSFVYLVAVLGLAAAVLAWLARRPAPIGDDSSSSSDEAGRSVEWRPPLLIAGVTAAVAWLQPIIDQVAGDGNLGNLLTSSGGGTGERIGLRLGVRLVSSVVALPPWWTRPSFSETIVSTGVIDTPSGPDVAEGNVAGLGPAALGLLAVGAVLGAIGWWAWRRRDRPVLTLGVLAAAAVAGCVLSMVLSPVNAIGLSPHQLRWLWPVGALLTAVALLALTRWIVPSVGVLGAGVVLTALLVVVNLPTHAAPEGPTADRRYLTSARRLLDGVDGYRPDYPVLFDIRVLRFAEPYSGPVIAALAANGVDLVFDDEGMVRQTGRGREASGTEDRRLLLIEGQATMTPPDGSTAIAVVDGLSDDQRVELARLRGQVVAMVRAEGLRLNEAGRAARAAGRIELPDVVFPPGADAGELEAGGGLAGLIRDGWVDLLPEHEPSARRYAELHERASTYTVGLFEAPVRP